MHRRHEIDGNGAKRRGGILAVMLVAVLGSNAAAAAPSAPCDMQLTVELKPDVPNPRDAGFLRATVRIAAISALDSAAPAKAPIVPTRRTLNLRWADLRSIQVQNPQQVTTLADSEQVQADAIVTAPLLKEERPHTHLSLVGIGSLYWAARHPTQAWRVLLPVQPRVGPDVTADIRARCLLFAESPSSRGAGCYFDAPVNAIH